MSHRILVVEDDPKLGLQITQHLKEAGFEPHWLERGDAALAVEPRDYALVILDLMLPGAFGLDVLKHLRRHSDLPVLVLSAKNDTAVKVRALELGADDYVTKPFWPEELLARVTARLRRPALARNGTISFGGLELDVDGRTLKVDGAPIELTRVEFEMLLALARRPGQALSRAWLAENVLDPERDGTERTLDVHVSRLRKKLGTRGALVATVWGVGYRLDAPEGT
ncbi:MAG: response regulator transcription factor [Planctomycetota bacterium]|nr:response regulator transcription factor [Planctomycetota bacterium]